jgi:magnesium chelatase accessory protein
LNRRLVWETDGRDWPGHAGSRFVDAGGVKFLVQVAGQGPVVLLLHGMGAATHTWRGLLPLLAERCTVVAPDLPGHGFSSMPADRDLSLPAMARSIGALLRTLGLAPVVVLGHSAGAAVAVRMVLDGAIAPHALISLNGALLPLQTLAGQLFSPVARFLVRFPMVPSLFTALAGDDGAVARLLHDTGSTIDAEGLRLYSRLVRNPGHVEGTLRMMSQWDLPGLGRDLPRLHTQLILVAARNDRTVPPSDAVRVRDLVKGARVELLPGLGHLAHEERPDLIAPIVFAALAEAVQPLEVPA